MATLDQEQKTEAFEDPRAPRRILTAEEGEAFLRRLAEPPRKLSPATVQVIRTRKRLLLEPSAQ